MHFIFKLHVQREDILYAKQHFQANHLNPEQYEPYFYTILFFIVVPSKHNRMITSILQCLNGKELPISTHEVHKKKNKFVKAIISKCRIKLQAFWSCAFQNRATKIKHHAFQNKVLKFIYLCRYNKSRSNKLSC